MDPSLNYVWRTARSGLSSGSSVRTCKSRPGGRKSPLTVATIVNPRYPPINHPYYQNEDYPYATLPKRAPQNQNIFFLSNAASASTKYDNRYHITSAESILMEPSYESVGRRRHLAESKGALNIPPISTIVCFVLLILYLFREKFDVHKAQDIYVTRELVFVKRQYWRLFIAQFFHFNRFNFIVNTITLFTIGRYLERKITKCAMFLVIFLMGAVTHVLYITFNPLVCGKLPASESTFGFGNVIYSLRVLLAYALEPRNYEKDLVYGLYPMVVSASHAPWQPLLDLFIFAIVLPEQCICGQAAGIAAGFLITFLLLLWPTPGVYIASPPYYWTVTGIKSRSNRNFRRSDSDDDKSKGADANQAENWRMETYSTSDFWMPSSATLLESEHPSEASTVAEYSTRNALQKKSAELKLSISNFLRSPTQSISKLMENITSSEDERAENERRKQIERKITGNKSPHSKLPKPLTVLERLLLIHPSSAESSEESSSESEEEMRATQVKFKSTRSLSTAYQRSESEQKTSLNRSNLRNEANFFLTQQI